MYLLISQLLLPVSLLIWLAFFPASGWLALCLQIITVAASLFGLSLVGLWVTPPYWFRILYWCLLAVIVGAHIARGRLQSDGAWLASPLESGFLFMVALLGLVGLYLGGLGLMGRQAPEVETVDIAPPFLSGRYLVAHGGSNSTVNIHLRTLDPELEQFARWRGQSRALDLFRIDSVGLHMRGWFPSDPTQYVTYGTSVVAPCAGRIALVHDGVADNRVPQMNREELPGNFVAIECNGNYLILAHLLAGSMEVRLGQQVAVGDVIGQIGNSGNSSEPHLHIHAQRGLPVEAPLSGEPLAITISGRFLVRNDRIEVP
jgi:hypothetical protein